jgi:hypothetical protein
MPCLQMPICSGQARLPLKSFKVCFGLAIVHGCGKAHDHLFAAHLHGRQGDFESMGCTISTSFSARTIIVCGSGEQVRLSRANSIRSLQYIQEINELACQLVVPVEMNQGEAPLMRFTHLDRAAKIQRENSIWRFVCGQKRISSSRR